MGVRNNRVPRDNDDIYFLDRPLSLAIGFSHRQNRGSTGSSAGDIEALSFVIFCYELDTLKGFIIYRVVIHSGKRF